MTAGAQPSQASVNQQVSAMVLAVRNDFQNIINFNAGLAANATEMNLTQAAYLESLGFTPADAASIVSTIGNHADLAAKYQGGSGGIALPFNYMANGQACWGLQ
jgi:hypothetical protein